MGQSALALERNSKDWTAVHFYRSSLRMHCLPTSAGRHRKMSTGRNKKPPAKPDRYLRGGFYWVILCRQINPIDTTPQISVRLCGWFLVSSGTHLPMPSGTRRQTVHSQRTSIKMNCGPILRVALQCKRRLAHARSIPMHPPDQSHTSLLTGASQTAQVGCQEGATSAGSYPV